MDIRFSDKKLEALYTEEKGAKKYPPGIVDAFFDAMTIIQAAKDEQEFYTVRSLRAKKLEGDRKGQWAIRLNKQYRLIVRIEMDDQGYYAEIIEIVDYHYCTREVYYEPATPARPSHTAWSYSGQRTGSPRMDSA